MWLLTLLPVIVALSIEDKLRDLPKIYYINLDRSTHRNEYMMTTLRAHVQRYERVPGFDGKDPTFKTYLNGSSRLSDTDTGCTMSHVKAIKTFALDATNTDPIAIIAEDDLSFDFVSLWTSSFTQYIHNLTTLDLKWEIFQLAIVPPSSDSNLFTLRKGWRYHATAYVITRKAAERYVAELMPDEKVIFGEDRGSIAEPFIYRRAVVWYHVPALFTYRDENDSHIHPSHLPGHVRMKNRNREMWLSHPSRQIPKVNDTST